MIFLRLILIFSRNLTTIFGPGSVAMQKSVTDGQTDGQTDSRIAYFLNSMDQGILFQYGVVCQSWSGVSIKGRKVVEAVFIQKISGLGAFLVWLCLYRRLLDIDINFQFHHVCFRSHGGSCDPLIMLGARALSRLLDIQCSLPLTWRIVRSASIG